MLQGFRRKKEHFWLRSKQNILVFELGLKNEQDLEWFEMGVAGQVASVQEAGTIQRHKRMKIYLGERTQSNFPEHKKNSDRKLRQEK